MRTGLTPLQRLEREVASLQSKNMELTAKAEYLEAVNYKLEGDAEIARRALLDVIESADDGYVRSKANKDDSL